MDGSDLWLFGTLGVVAGVAAGLAAAWVAMRFLRGGGPAEDGGRGKKRRGPASKERKRLAKDKRRQERAGASARLEGGLEEFRGRLGVPPAAVEDAVRKDPAAAAKALGKMMKE